MEGECRWTGRGREQVWVGKMSEAGVTYLFTIFGDSFFKVERRL